MGNVNLPTPVVLAGAGLCLLGGYLLGVVAGPESPDRTVAEVKSFTAEGNRLCLEGESVADLAGAKDDVLCGVWRRVNGDETPEVGDQFRFVSTFHAGQSGEDDDRVTIFGEVAD